MMINGAAIWSAVKTTVGAAYKAALLYLAFVFVEDTIEFHKFAYLAIKAFYDIAKGLGS